jgi:hypothetical protein
MGKRKPTPEEKTLAVLVSKPDNYDASCVSLRDVAKATGLSEGAALAALDALCFRGLAEYHRPREAPAYWRVSNEGRRVGKVGVA